MQKKKKAREMCEVDACLSDPVITKPRTTCTRLLDERGIEKGSGG